MTPGTFTREDSSALGGPPWMSTRRANALDRLETLVPPTADGSEVWRYSPVDRFDVGAYRPSAPARGEEGEAAAQALGAEFGTGIVVVVRNGRVVEVSRAGVPGAVVLGAASSLAERPAALGSVVGDDFFVALNDGFAPDAVVVEVPERCVVEEPIVVVHWCETGAPDGPAPASFPRTLVQLGEDAEVKVVEVLAGPDAGRALVVPVGELVVGDRARLSYVLVQDLGMGDWSIGRLAATVGRDAKLRSFTAGLGADYDRCRVDVAALGDGSSTQITSVYLGSGDQVHDVRTLQDHAAPRSLSNLLCKGAVAERSRSIYSGLIKVRNGAVRSDAMQTNHNLVLDPTAHADSVPNLDIEENDVRCSHASSVGPVGEDQRYYLESRGLSPERAERLIVLGFFDDVVERSPIASATAPLRRRIGQRLEGLLGRGGER